MKKSVKIGVLAFQGAFAEHEFCLKNAAALNDRVEVEVVQVRNPSDIDGLDGLVIPGGESTTMAHYLRRNGFITKIAEWKKGNGRKPFVWGTCAGLILLANKTTGTKTGGQISIGGLDITACRNTFGRQRESFEKVIKLESKVLQGNGSSDYHGIFIRAPGIESVDNESVEILATASFDGKEWPVAVQQGNYMAASFHPELTEDFRWHSYFIEQILKSSL